MAMDKLSNFQILLEVITSSGWSEVNRLDLGTSASLLNSESSSTLKDIIYYHNDDLTNKDLILRTSTGLQLKIRP
jgi:hypothetical protein